ncbi:hypothetical protein FJTKL_07185 [Diaporthe vaccinii]|uniref:Acetyl-coenzyme A synthetase N-terminal domain-containing protein n=1 Tax=Diaporthe vaccinii TaxID=105482 RepID=A0ABR4DRR7_9PEZI
MSSTTEMVTRQSAKLVIHGQEDEVDVQDTYNVPEAYYLKHPGTPVLASLDDYHALHERSLADPDAFWAQQAHDLLEWETPFKKVHHGGFEHGDMAWFPGGKLNASVNCVDRHAFQSPDKVAIEFEPHYPDAGQRRQLSYSDLLREWWSKR